MKKTFKRVLSLLLCALMLMPLYGVQAAAVQSEDPMPRACSSAEGASRFSLFATAEQSYTEKEYEHDPRFSAGYEIIDFIDISKHNGTIDWNKVYADGIKNVILRAGYRGSTQGGLFTDDMLEANLSGALAAGLNVGVYFYTQAITEAEAIEEAEYTLDLIKDSRITLPVVYDCEYAEDTSGVGYAGRFYEANLTKAQTTNNCLAFCSTVKNAGYQAMIYANPFMLNSVINAGTIKSAGYSVWLAEWKTKATYTGDYSMWQYTYDGRVNGINGRVDMNFMYVEKEKTAEELDIVKITSSKSRMDVQSSARLAASIDKAELDDFFDSYTCSEVEWSSSNTSVITVDGDGNAVAVAAGSARVTASVRVSAAKDGKTADYVYEDAVDITVDSTATGIMSILVSLFTMFITFLTALIGALA